jgi:16S rRNA (cytosine1402-N4)-methyltransferase
MRDAASILTTLDLVRAVEGATGPQRAKDRIHPATRTFQALRIFVNGELDELAKALTVAEDLLEIGGRLVVVTFHSLEDRIVKRFFTSRAGKLPSPSRHQLETADETAASFTLPFKGHVGASEAEANLNPRARSAKMRVGIRTPAKSWPVNYELLGVPSLEGRKRR